MLFAINTRDFLGFQKWRKDFFGGNQKYDVDAVQSFHAQAQFVCLLSAYSRVVRLGTR